jgi:hypothetical protein
LQLYVYRKLPDFFRELESRGQDERGIAFTYDVDDIVGHRLPDPAHAVR